MKQIDFNLKVVATVRNVRSNIEDDFWENIVSEITLEKDIPTETIKNIGQFSHLEIVFLFHLVDQTKIINSGCPRGNPNYPEMGIFAQRKKERVNQLGLSIVELLEIKGRTLKVKYLDALDGTPVLDIKPVFKEFLPKGEIRQPSWVSDITENYW